MVRSKEVTTPVLTVIREVLQAERNTPFDGLVNAIIDKMKVEHWPEEDRAPKLIVRLIVSAELMRGALEDALSKTGTGRTPKLTGPSGKWTFSAGKVKGFGSFLPPVAEDQHPDDYDFVIGPTVEVRKGKGRVERIIAPVEPGDELVDDFKRWLKSRDLVKDYEAIGPLGLFAVDTEFAWHLQVIKRPALAEEKAA